MTVLYSLRNDEERVRSIQKATRTSTEFGIEPTHGLVGSKEWWENIASGKLPVVSLAGTVKRIFMGSMGDWPLFEMEDDLGNCSRWTREADSRDLFDSYAEGRFVEVDYVVQNHRPNSWDHGGETKLVLEIRLS